jgi:membrane peptidoglycan carboxypeptidase
LRKVKEFVLAIQIERKYSKDEILLMYLNEAPYGGTSWVLRLLLNHILIKCGRPEFVESAILAVFLKDLPSILLIREI